MDRLPPRRARIRQIVCKRIMCRGPERAVNHLGGTVAPVEGGSALLPHLRGSDTRIGVSGRQITKYGILTHLARTQKNRSLLLRSHGKTKESFEIPAYDLVKFTRFRGSVRAQGVMSGRLNRALLGAAGVAVIWAAAATASAAAPNGLSVPEPRLAGAFTLDIPVVIPASTSGPQDLLRNPLEEISAKIDLGDGVALESGVNVDVESALNHYAPSAYDGLFYSSAALGSPYLSLSSGGAWLAFSIESLNGLSFTVGHASSAPGLNPYLVTPRSAYAAMTGTLPYDARSTDSVLAGMSWDFAKWGGLSLTAAQTTERGGAFALGNPAINRARTQALGVTAHVRLGSTWVTTATYSEGLTELDLKPSAFGPDPKLYTQSYGVAVAKNSVFSKHDALGVAFARPAGNYQPFTTDTSNELQFFGRDKLLGTAQETDFELGYKTEFLGDSVALQANAAYQMNFGGQTGNNAVSLLSRAKIKF